MRDPNRKTDKKPGKFKKSFIDKMNNCHLRPDVEYNEDEFEFIKAYNPVQAREFKEKFSFEEKSKDAITQNKKIFKLLTDLMFA